VFDLPTDLPAELVPLSWLLGVWEGTGVIDYHDRADAVEFTHRVSFSHDGGSSLNYSATANLVSADGERGAALVSEVGFWRLDVPVTDADPGPALLPAGAAAPRRTAEDIETLRNAESGFDISATIVHSDGGSELYLGQIRGPRIDVATDAIVRPPGARGYGAATRMYGLVDGHLLWAWDIAAFGHELGSHASARLARVA
jgi:hypothetical protein